MPVWLWNDGNCLHRKYCYGKWKLCFLDSWFYDQSFISVIYWCKNEAETLAKQTKTNDLVKDHKLQGLFQYFLKENIFQCTLYRMLPEYSEVSTIVSHIKRHSQKCLDNCYLQCFLSPRTISLIIPSYKLKFWILRVVWTKD